MSLARFSARNHPQQTKKRRPKFEPQESWPFPEVPTKKKRGENPT